MHCVGASVHVVLFNPHHSVFSMNLKKKKNTLDQQKRSVCCQWQVCVCVSHSTINTFFFFFNVRKKKTVQLWISYNLSVLRNTTSPQRCLETAHILEAHTPLFSPLLLSFSLQHGNSSQEKLKYVACPVSVETVTMWSFICLFFFFCSWCQWHIVPRSAQVAATGLKSNRAVTLQSWCKYISSSSRWSWKSR